MQEHEHRHRLGRDVFHGQRGRLRQRYRQGQEDQLSALGLVLNAIVTWNTTYMTDAINTLPDRPRPEDLQRLTAGFQPHQQLGRFSFELPDRSKPANADRYASPSVNSRRLTTRTTRSRSTPTDGPSLYVSRARYRR